MTWMDSQAAQSLDAQLAKVPALHAKYQQFLRTLWRDERVPPRLLELARLRIAAIHDAQEQWQQRRASVQLTPGELVSLQSGDCSGFEPLARQVLEVAELMPLNHHDITDEQVAGLEEAFGPAGTVALLTALAFFDVNARLSKAMGLTADAKKESSYV